MSPPTLGSCSGKSDIKQNIVCGRINGPVCNSLLVDTGSCVAKSLVDHGNYPGGTAFIQELR